MAATPANGSTSHPALDATQSTTLSDEATASDMVTGEIPEPDITLIGELPLHVWRPENPNGAGVVLVHEIFGITRYIQARAAQLADTGFLVVVPELFWRSEVSTIAESDEDALNRAIVLAGQTPWEDAVADVLAAYDRLRSLGANGIGLLGICYGGGVAFDAASSISADALVSYYGSALPGLLDRETSTPSLHHFGLSDDYLPSPMLEQIREALDGPHAQFEYYDDAGHAFDNPAPLFHHAEASARAWPLTLRFLQQHLVR